MATIFSPAPAEVFFKSTKQGDPRLGDLVSKNTDQPGFIIAGYPDDEGIRVNGGRVGAASAPNTIRKYFYKMTPSAWKHESVPFADIGNLLPQSSLEARHEALKNEIAAQLAAGKKWIGLGGGHDYGYPDGAGFLLSQKTAAHKPLVINFDAHLDVRPTDQGLSSGTPFFRLLSDKTLPAFDFVEVGLQPQCNSAAHLKWLEERGGHVVSFEELNLHGNPVETLLERLAPFLLHPRPTFLSVDIDAFSSAYAPGCSQSWATGLVPNDFMRLFALLKKRLDIRVLGIYEVSPPLDIDDRTSKLAAQIAHAFLY